jgi:hypothetical protein
VTEPAVNGITFISPIERFADSRYSIASPPKGLKHFNMRQYAAFLELFPNAGRLHGSSISILTWRFIASSVPRHENRTANRGEKAHGQGGVTAGRQYPMR